MQSKKLWNINEESKGKIMSTTNLNVAVSFLDGGGFSTNFTSQKTINSCDLDKVVIDEDCIVTNSRIKRIESSESVLLDRCDVDEVISAKQLIMIDCSFNRAQAGLNALIRPKKFPDGTVVIGPITAGNKALVILPSGIRSITYRWMSFTNYYAIPNCNQFVFQDCRIDGNIIFPHEASLAAKKAILKGRTHFTGEVICGSLTDKRKQSI